MTPGLRGSSSLTLKTIFIRSEPMSAILVKMPPAIRSADAPSDSPIANPRKQYPTICRGTNSRMMIINTNSSEIRNSPTLMPARSGMFTTSHGSPRSDAHALDLDRFDPVHLNLVSHELAADRRHPDQWATASATVVAACVYHQLRDACGGADPGVHQGIHQRSLQARGGNRDRVARGRAVADDSLRHRRRKPQRVLDGDADRRADGGGVLR